MKRINEFFKGRIGRFNYLLSILIVVLRTQRVCPAVSALMYIDVTDFSLHPNIHYRKKGQPKRAWTREIYYSDMDSVTIARWDDLSDKEKVDAIREAFNFDIDEKEWSKYSDSENLKMLLGNTFVEWK